MTSQFHLTRFYDGIMRNSVSQLGFLTREFKIPRTTYSYLKEHTFMVTAFFDISRENLMHLFFIFAAL